MGRERSGVSATDLAYHDDSGSLRVLVVIVQERVVGVSICYMDRTMITCVDRSGGVDAASYLFRSALDFAKARSQAAAICLMVINLVISMG